MGYRFIHVNLELGPNHLIEVEIKKECFVWLMTYSEFENMKAERQFSCWGGRYTVIGMSGLVQLRIPHQDYWRCVVTNKDREPEVIRPEFKVFTWTTGVCSTCGGAGQVTKTSFRVVTEMVGGGSQCPIYTGPGSTRYCQTSYSVIGMPGWFHRTRGEETSRSYRCDTCGGQGSFAGWRRVESFVYP